MESPAAKRPALTTKSAMAILTLAIEEAKAPDRDGDEDNQRRPEVRPQARRARPIIWMLVVAAHCNAAFGLHKHSQANDVNSDSVLAATLRLPGRFAKITNCICTLW